MILAGGIPGALGYFLGTPLFLVKNRLQGPNVLGRIDVESGKYVTVNTTSVESSELKTRGNFKQRQLYSGTWDCLKKIYYGNHQLSKTSSNITGKNIKNLFQGAVPMMFRGAGISSGSFLGYDGCKTILKEQQNLLEEGILLHSIGAIAAAFFCACFSTPFDFIANRCYHNRDFINNRSHIDLKTTIKENGMSILYRGWSAQFAKFGLINVVWFPLYEQLRERVFKIGYFD